MRKVKHFFISAWKRISEFFAGLFGKKRPGGYITNNPAEGYYSNNSGESSEGSTIVFKNEDASLVKKISSKGQPVLKKEPVIPTEQLRGRGRSFSSSFKKRDSRPLFIIGVIITTAKVAIVAVAIIAVALMGAVFGVANAYLGTTPELDLAQLQDNDLTSFVYDANGTLITSYAGLENRDYATLDEIPMLLQKAVISIEDVRFEHHNGVDIKRLFGAALSNLSNTSSGGGSTITQQLIKNKLLTSERSYKRKIQEASLALQLEKKYSKEQILEAYLNSIPLGGLNYGVKAAAMDYFGKELDDLSLREIACLAGITQNPYAYNPRSVYYGSANPQKLAERRERLNARIEKVLKAMYQAGYISLDEYNSAMADELSVIEVSTVNKLYDHPHFVEYAIENVVTAFLQIRNLEDTTSNRQTIENELRTGGYNIYTTIDPTIQNSVEESVVSYVYPQLNDSADSTTSEYVNGTLVELVQPQAAAVVIDQSTGCIKAMVGSRTPPTVKKSQNLATNSSSQVGSSIKPLAVYGPALDTDPQLGLGSTIANIKVPIPGWDTKEGYPTTSHTNKRGGITYGPVSIKNGIKFSLNIVAARTLMEYTGIDTAYNYLVQLGIDETNLNKDCVGMTLGSSGISTLDMTAAYSAIANGGEYIEPIAFTSITDRYGNTILEASEVQEKHRVFQESTAYMLINAMTQAVEGGTGTNAKIDGITVAGKTGTNAKNRGVFFAGMTGYYTSAVWIGHTYFKPLKSTSGGSGAAPLWQSYMAKILEGSGDKAIMPGSPSSYGLAEYRVCAVSGMLATEACDYDASGRTPVTELYPVGSGLQECNMHSSFNICSVSGQVATEYCPQTNTSQSSVVVLDPESDYLKMDRSELLDIFPYVVISSAYNTDPETGELVYSDEEYIYKDGAGNIVSSRLSACSIHTYDWHLNQEELNTAIAFAQSAINDYSSLLADYDILLSDQQRYELSTYMNSLQAAINGTDSAAVYNAANALASAVSYVRDSLNGVVPDV